MRTTVNLDDDVATEISKMQREESLGLSEAVNTLARRGIARPRPDFTYSPITFDMGHMIDITSTERTLELLDELDAMS